MIFPTGFKLSRNKHLPVFKILWIEFWPHQVTKLLYTHRRLSIVDSSEEFVSVKCGASTVRLLPEYFLLLMKEWPIWEKFYRPRFSLIGKTVLDVGAGNGETIAFYLLHGAEKVISIESDNRNVEIIRENARRNRWNAVIINERFGLSQIPEDLDFMKVDVEGAENELLKLDSLPAPCVIETHSPELRDSFISKFRMREVARLTESISLLSFP